MLNLQVVVVITPVAAGEKTPTTPNRETTWIKGEPSMGSSFNLIKN